MTSFTTSFFTLKRGFRQFARVSPDGHYFPTQPEKYRHEARLQAQELYGLRRLRVNSHKLAPAASAWTSHHYDKLPLRLRVMIGLMGSLESSLQPLPTELLASMPCGNPRSFSELFDVRSKSGSEATSMDDLPRMVIMHLQGFGIAVLRDWLCRLRRNESSHFLTAVIHLCLVHKEPTLLLRNSRSILLEPILRRLESAVVLLRLFARAECSHWFDPWIFSYRKEVTPVHLSLFTRWAVAYWATEFGAVYVADWDESNSFCNLCRTDSPALLANYPNLNCGDCGSNDFIHPSTCTSRHLSEPYRMLQGAAQGDSMGFGAYMLLRILRDKALRTTVSGPPHPCLTSEEGPEVVFADDSRQFGRSAAELGTIVNAAATLANESGASVHPDKLRAYCINLSAGKLVYRADTVYTDIGPLVTHHSGLRVVGIPCVMGDDVSSLLAVSQRAAQNVLRSVCRYRPSYILALRIMLAYVVSSLEYKLAIVPVTVAELAPLQRLLN